MTDKDDQTDHDKPLLLRTRDAEAYQRFQKAVEWPMLVLALGFAVALVVPFVAEVSEATRTALEATIWFIWAAFVFEYLALLFLAPERWHMVRTHVLDLVIILVPFLRPLRLLRLRRCPHPSSTRGESCPSLRTGMQRAGRMRRRTGCKPNVAGWLSSALTDHAGRAVGELQEAGNR